MVSFGSDTFGWDYLNRLISSTVGATTTIYTYTPVGERLSHKVGASPTTTFVTEGYEVEGDSITKRIYLPSNRKEGNLLLATVKPSLVTINRSDPLSLGPIIYYIHSDHLGGTNVVTGSIGNVVEVADYLPFGKIRLEEQAGSFTENRKFTGHKYDAETDLNYMNARYQDGKIGRFLSQDPAFKVVGKSQELKNKTGLELEQYLSDPQQLNSYSYVKNNPLKYVDPTGEFPIIATLVGLLTPNVAYAPTNENFQNPGLETAILVGSLAVPGGASGKGANKAVGVAVNKVDDLVKGGDTLLFRAMREGADGMPLLEDSARGLGVRPGRDIIIDIKGMVHPKVGGMSAVPDNPSNLQIHRRPQEFGGTGKDPVWCIQCSSLPSSLKYIPDSPTHGTIQPSNIMTKDNYNQLLQSTKVFWKKL